MTSPHAHLMLGDPVADDWVLDFSDSELASIHWRGQQLQLRLSAAALRPRRPVLGSGDGTVYVTGLQLWLDQAQAVPPAPERTRQPWLAAPTPPNMPTSAPVAGAPVAGASMAGAPLTGSASPGGQASWARREAEQMAEQMTEQMDEHDAPWSGRLSSGTLQALGRVWRQLPLGPGGECTIDGPLQLQLCLARGPVCTWQASGLRLLPPPAGWQAAEQQPAWAC